MALLRARDAVSKIKTDNEDQAAGVNFGALIIGVLNNTLDLINVSAYWQQIIKGMIIVGAVILDQRKTHGHR